MGQFFYQMNVPGVGPRLGSFNLDNVVYTEEFNPGRILVILDDMHEEYRNMEVPTAKGGVKVELRKVEVSTRIQLTNVDSERFMKLHDAFEYNLQEEKPLKSVAPVEAEVNEG